MGDRFLIRDDGVVYPWRASLAAKPNFREFIPVERREEEEITTDNTPEYQIAQARLDERMRRMDKPNKKLGRPRK